MATRELPVVRTSAATAVGSNVALPLADDEGSSSLGTTAFPQIASRSLARRMGGGTRRASGSPDAGA
jgi:hypothetical protein